MAASESVVATAGTADGVPRNVILQGHVLDVLRSLPDECVQTVVTSPPYYALRRYNTEPQVWGGDPMCEHEWLSQRYYREGGNSTRSALAFSEAGPENVRRIKETRWHENVWCGRCLAWRGELGSEPTVQLYISHLVQVFEEVRRVLRPDGTCWLNIGDSFAGSWGNYAPRGLTYEQRERHEGGERWERKGYGEDSAWLPLAAKSSPGLKNKDLCLVPQRLAIALQEAGWYMRMDCIWHKSSAMPESVEDRPTRAHEYLWLLAKSERYFYDSVAIQEPLKRPEELKRATPAVYGGRQKHEGYGTRIHSGNEYTGELSGRNRRSVFTIGPSPFPEAHFAVMPEGLAEIGVLAGTSPYACETCGAPWQRQTKRRFQRQFDVTSDKAARDRGKGLDASNSWQGFPRGVTAVETLGWQPTCRCRQNTGTGQCVVLDPFSGAGTTLLLAQRHGRDYLGVELNPAYAAMSRKRLLTAGCAHTSLAPAAEDGPEQLALFS